MVEADAFAATSVDSRAATTTEIACDKLLILVSLGEAYMNGLAAEPGTPQVARRRGGPRLGAHMSVAGGLPRAVERAVVHRCDALQIFAKNANQWRGRVGAPGGGRGVPAPR